MRSLRAGLFIWTLIYLPLDAQQVDIDLSTAYQTMDGFGGMNHTSWVEDLNEDHRAKVFGNEPGNIGLSILRIHIDPNPNRFLEQLPTATFAIEKGVKVFASPWDPPSHLIDASSGDRKLPYANYGAYVDHLNGFNTFMQNNGVPLYALSVQNEPDIGEWTSWTIGEMLTFVKEFAQHIDNRVLAPESFNFNRSYSNPILNDSTACSHLDIVGGHIYGNGLFDYPLAREKGKPVWMTEHLTGSDAPALNNWSLALDLGIEINKCMEANFNAYIWWYIRRFYGLLLDDGNISQKGYVMSHYSKFVRPGAIRVEAIVSSAPGVYASAFKTDSSLTIVAVNKSATSREINFVVQNGTFSEYVKFTSTKNKYQVNKGILESITGSFTATLEPYSISTLTTSPGAGGKYGNIPPVADAGEDQLIETDEPGSSVSFILDASASTDPDGQIRNYSWSSGGKQISWSPSLEVSISEGERTIFLTVTDNDGARSMDTVKLTVKKRYNTELWFEAECAEVGSVWEYGNYTTASNNAYVNAPEGSQLPDAPSDREDDLISFRFNVTEEGIYKVWGRVVSPNAGANSFWVKMDDSDWISWDPIPLSRTWHWDDVHAGDNSTPASFNLLAGEHLLSVGYKEDGVLLDKILIANTNILPTGLGGTAETCELVSTRSDNEDLGINVYPNPTGGKVLVEWDSKFTRLEFVTLTGQTVFSKSYKVPVDRDELLIHTSPGVYFMVVHRHDSSAVAPIIFK